MLINFIKISVSVFSLYLILILVSFNSADPGWLQTTWDGTIYNIGGMIGAQFADFLLFIFGVSAYAIPVLIILCVWRIHTKTVCFIPFIIACKLIKTSLLLCMFCSVIHCLFGEIFDFPIGGVIGSILCHLIASFQTIIMCHIGMGMMLLLMGIVVVLGIVSNRFFLNIVVARVKKIFGSICELYSFFTKNRKNVYSFINRKLYDNLHDYPVVFAVKKDNFHRKLINHISKERQLSNLSYFGTVECAKEYNFDIKNNLIKPMCVLSGEISINNQYSYFIQDQLKCIISDPMYIYMNYCIKKDTCLTDSSVKKIHNQSINRCPKQLVFDDIIPCNKRVICKQNRKYNDNVVDMQNANTASIINSRQISTKSFINNDIKNTVVTCSDNMRDISMISSKRYRLCHQESNFPNVNLLTVPVRKKIINSLEIKRLSHLLEKKLLEYRIVANVVNVISGPVITRFELNLSPGMKSSKIFNLSRDLARVLLVPSIKVMEVIPGSPYVGLEIPNKKRNMVYLHGVINSEVFQKMRTPLPLALGQDTSGASVVVDLRNMPHLLVAGTTGSGKSVGINTMIISILYRSGPEDVQFIMIDPKMLELSIYSSIPHILHKVITDVQDVNGILQWCVQEMERRYQLMARVNVRNIEDYNRYIAQLCLTKYKERCCDDINIDINKNVNDCADIFNKFPYIVIIIDEFSDLMITTTKKVEELIIRLTQKARAAGMHVILATQRPSVDVITGLIKANIPARIAFTVSSKIDSRTILGQSGAESLLGMGDMLYLAANTSVPIRVHGAFIQDKEIESVVNFWSQ